LLTWLELGASLSGTCRGKSPLIIPQNPQLRKKRKKEEVFIEWCKIGQI